MKKLILKRLKTECYKENIPMCYWMTRLMSFFSKDIIGYYRTKNDYGDEVFDAFYRALNPYTTNSVYDYVKMYWKNHTLIVAIEIQIDGKTIK